MTEQSKPVASQPCFLCEHPVHRPGDCRECTCLEDSVMKNLKVSQPETSQPAPGDRIFWKGQDLLCEHKLSEDSSIFWIGRFGGGMTLTWELYGTVAPSTADAEPRVVAISESDMRGVFGHHPEPNLTELAELYERAATPIPTPVSPTESAAPEDDHDLCAEIIGKCDGYTFLCAFKAKHKGVHQILYTRRDESAASPEPPKERLVSEWSTFNINRLARIVTPERAELAATRLIDSHFNNPGREHARMSIPVNIDDDDIVILDFIKQRGAASSTPAEPPKDAEGWIRERFGKGDWGNTYWMVEPGQPYSSGRYVSIVDVIRAYCGAASSSPVPATDASASSTKER